MVLSEYLLAGSLRPRWGFGRTCYATKINFDQRCYSKIFTKRIGVLVITHMEDFTYDKAARVPSPTTNAPTCPTLKSKHRVHYLKALAQSWNAMFLHPNSSPYRRRYFGVMILKRRGQVLSLGPAIVPLHMNKTFSIEGRGTLFV